MKPFKEQKDEAQHHGDDRRKAHALELNGTEDDGRAAEAGNHRHGRENEVLRPSVVNLLFDEHAQARRGDEAEQENAHAAHNRRRNGVNESCYLADKGKDNGEPPKLNKLGTGKECFVVGIGGK